MMPNLWFCGKFQRFPEELFYFYWQYCSIIICRLCSCWSGYCLYISGSWIPRNWNRKTKKHPACARCFLSFVPTPFGSGSRLQRRLCSLFCFVPLPRRGGALTSGLCLVSDSFQDMESLSIARSIEAYNIDSINQALLENQKGLAVFKLNYSTTSFRQPCLVTTQSLSPSLPQDLRRGTSGIPDSLDLTGGFGFLEHCRSPRSERISRTTRVQEFFDSFSI